MKKYKKTQNEGCYTKQLVNALPKYQGQEIQGTIFRLKESRKRVIKYNA